MITEVADLSLSFLFRYKVNLKSAKSQEKLKEVKTSCFFLAIHV